MPKWFRRGSDDVNPDPSMAHDAIRRFNESWPNEQTLVSWWPAVEAVADFSAGTRMDVAGLLLLTDELLIFAWAEHDTGIAHVTPLPRVVESLYQDERLGLVAAHPTMPGRMLYSDHLVTLGAAREPSFITHYEGFLRAVAARVPNERPRDEQLWPQRGVGLGSAWAHTMSPDDLAQALGPFRLVARDA